MRFIGNKESLAPKIYQIIKQHCIIDSSSIQSFCDMFAGSASVGKFFKNQGFSVYSCDMLYFSYCLQKAYIENSQIPTFNNLKNILNIQQINKRNSLFANEQDFYQKVLHFLNSLNGIKGFIYQSYAPNGSKDLAQPRMYFSDDNAQKIDAIRMQIEIWKEREQINDYEYFILLATLIESVSFFANVAGVYAAFCKKWDKRALKPFALKEIEFIVNNKKHFCFYGNSTEIFSNINKHFDILYLDPPYNHRQYAPNYHLIETIAKYDNPKIKGIAGLREWKNQKSAFCNAKSALVELESIAKYQNYRNLVLSYNSEGIMKKKEIDEIFKPLGKVYFETIPYPRFKSNKNEGKKHIEEYVWILRK